MKSRVLLVGTMMVASIVLQAEDRKPTAATSTIVADARLQLKSTTKLSLKGSVFGKIRCDDNGNLFIRPTNLADSNQDRKSSLPVLKITSSGSRAGEYRVTDISPNFKVIDFFVSGDGEVFQAARSDEELDIYVISYPANSEAKAVRLETEYFIPYQIAVFRTGDFLLSGVRGDHDRTPYTAVFDAKGRLIKTIYEAEDDDAQRRAEKGEANYKPDNSNYGNYFVTHGDAALGSDGNVYLLRAGQDALIYVISNKGEVVRKLRVVSPRGGLVAQRLKSKSGQLAISFLAKGMTTGAIVISDYDGQVLSTLPSSDPHMLPGLFGCYDSKNLRFMSFDENNQLQIHNAELK